MSNPDSSHLPLGLSNLPENPFPGIRPYAEIDAPIFFGRETQIQPILELLSSNHLVTVTGASACGKSSLLNAGILPLLRSGLYGDNPLIVTCTPGKDPFRSFAEAFADETTVSLDERTLEFSTLEGLMERSGVDSERPVIVMVDQFEEVFRLIDEVDSRASNSPPANGAGRTFRTSAFSEIQCFTQFLAGIPEMENGYLLIGIRSDFLKDCSRFKLLAELIAESFYITSLLSRHDLEFAIRGPLQYPVYRCKASDATIARILNDLSDDPDQLPLLQVYLRDAYASARIKSSGQSKDPFELPYDVQLGNPESEASDQRDLPFKYFLDRTGEALVQSTKVDSERVMLFFGCLFHLDTEHRAVRRMVSLAEIDRSSVLNAQEVQQIAEPFVAADWIVEKTGKNGETVFDITHEALLRKWDLFSLLVQRATRLHRLTYERKGPWILTPTNAKSLNLAAGPYGDSARYPESIWAAQWKCQNAVKARRCRHRIGRAIQTGVLALLLAPCLYFAYLYQEMQVRAKDALAVAKLAQAEAKESTAKTAESLAIAAKLEAEARAAVDAAAFQASLREKVAAEMKQQSQASEAERALTQQRISAILSENQKWREAQAEIIIGSQDALQIGMENTVATAGITIVTYSPQSTPVSDSEASYDRLHILTAPRPEGLDFVGGTSLDSILRDPTASSARHPGSEFVAGRSTAPSWQSEYFPGFFLGIYRFPEATLLGGLDSQRKGLNVWWNPDIGLKHFEIPGLQDAELLVDASITKTPGMEYRITVVTDSGRESLSIIRDLGNDEEVVFSELTRISGNISGVIDVVEMPTATIYLCRKGGQWTLHEKPVALGPMRLIGTFKGRDVRIVACKYLTTNALFAVLHDEGVSCYILHESVDPRFFPVKLNWINSDLKSLNELDPPTKAAFTQNGDTLAIGTESGKTFLWEVNRSATANQTIMLGEEPYHRFDLDPTDSSPVTALAWSAPSDGSSRGAALAGANEAGTVVLWRDARSSATGARKSAPPKHLLQNPLTLRPKGDTDTTPVSALHFSGDSVLASITRAGTIKAFPVKPRHIGRFELFPARENYQHLAFYTKFSADKMAEKGLLRDYRPGEPPGLYLDERKFYIAARWDYNLIRKEVLRERPIRVYAVDAEGAKVGEPIQPVWAVDWGPGEGRPFDFQISRGLSDALETEAAKSGGALGDRIQVEFDLIVDSPAEATP